MSRNIILLGIIFVISGCGMMGSSSKKDTTLATTLDIDSNRTYEVNSTNELNNSTDTTVPTITIAKSDILPQTISMDFPEILVDTKEDNNQTSETNTTDQGSNSEINSTDENESIPIVNNIGYNQLKSSISKIKDIVTVAQVNLVLLEKVMPQVLDKCEGMISCVFEPKYLSIVLDNETISQIGDITKDSNFTIKVDDNVTNKLLLGKVSFSKYND
ncbi:MAG: hypothetical protein KAU90_08970, partial [Sulfurovaceae bacterium]|nr:hypothetical protein [Sulfurovaceae bacterium]